MAFRLIQAGASVNAKGLDNQTPLHDAAVNGHVKVVKLLVERGADVNAKNMKGKTPLDVAPPGIVPYLTDTNLSNNGKCRVNDLFRYNKRRREGDGFSFL